MKNIYFAAAAVLTVAGAYWAGGRAAFHRCRAELAIERIASDVRMQNVIIKIKAKINEETYNTGAGAVRDSLRAKYTIRD
ncbi:MAG: hypothetical protein LBJ73_02065 [Rickettsiales bacterium]|jgi:hypothetical protein|nr:hypothetical protein [Rickettsiales bacterium]